MHSDFRVYLFGYDRTDTAPGNWIWRVRDGLPVELVSVKFSDLAEGRCDSCEVVIVGTKTDIDALGIDVDQEFRINVRGVSEETASVRYYGYIKEIDQGVGTHDRMKRTLIIGGLMEQLDDVLAFRYYNKCFIGAAAGPYGGLVQNLLTDVIIGESNVNVLNSFTEIDALPTLIGTTDIPDIAVAEMIARLAEVEGGVVYGVDHNAKLYFKARPPSYAHTFQIGQDGVKVVRLNKSNEHVKNSFIVRCKTLMAGGELVFEVIDDRLATHPEMRIRQKAVNTPEFGDNTGAIDFAEALIEKLRDPSEPIRLELAEFTDPMWANEKINLKNELGVSFGAFPVQALHWDITPNKCGLTIELNEVEPDMSSQARELLRLQRIGASRALSNNIELIGERYSWLITARRSYANQFQTRNFWGSQTDDEETLDLPEPGEITNYPYPVFEDGIKAMCGVPVPQNEIGNNIDSTVVESKNIEVGVVRDQAALGIDNQFRVVRWNQNEYNKYCHTVNLGGCRARMSKTDWAYPIDWTYGGSGTDCDTAFWYEASMSILTDLTIQFAGLGNLSSSTPHDEFHIYWCASTDKSGVYPPEENCCHMRFENNSGTLVFKTFQEYHGATTLRYTDSIPMSTISGVWLFKADIDRNNPDPTYAWVKISYWDIVSRTWVKIFDTGAQQYAMRSRSFWGARWDRGGWYPTTLQVYLHHCYFSGVDPLLSVSRDEGENWLNVTAETLTDISGLPTVGTSLKMKAAITHYHLIKGWCMAFK